MSSASDSESDIEIKTHLPQKSIKKPAPKSPQEHLQKAAKKLTTKQMIHSALKELNTRKGVSLYAIKSYMVEKYGADTGKLNFYIKKYIKNGVEAGEIKQIKGIGASGSFKLVPVKKSESKIKKKKKKIEKPDKPKKEKVNKVDLEKRAEKKVSKKEKLTKEKMTKEKLTKKEVKKPKVKMTKETKKEKKPVEKKGGKAKKTGGDKLLTPIKKKVTMMKRKSIGSIIKPPKMKPKKRD